MTVPQVLITLSPSGTLVAELPGANGSRRKVELRTGEAGESLLRMLTAQLHSRYEIGSDGAPTERQVKHWEKHQIFADDRCPFCIAEGRVRGGKPRQSRPAVLDEHGGVTVRRVAAKSRKITDRPLTLADLGL